MKKLTNSNLRRLVCASLFIGCTIQAQGQSCENCFVTTWDTQADGQAGNRTIMLPITEGRYDVDVNNDGDFDFRDLIGIQPITFATAGINTIRVRPSPTYNTNNQLRIRLYESGGEKKLSVIKQWGSIVWTSMSNAFRDCSNMTIADDPGVPNLTEVEDMRFIFSGATIFNGDLSGWNVSNVTDMRFAFREAANFNSDLSDWNVSTVTDMRFAFRGATNFTSDLSSWNVSNVTDMSGAFREATNFNSDLSSWDVSKVERMRSMFNGASLFNPNEGLNDWNVSNVATMQKMFFRATNFNRDVSNWNVSNVTDMTEMFSGATSFTSENYDALLTEWAKLTLQNDVTFTAPPTTYCAGKAGRDILTDTYNWDITGDTFSCPVEPFVTTWTVTASDTTIKLPIYDDPNRTDDTYDVDTNNDGTFDMTNQIGLITITFTNAGRHTIAVRPNPTSNASKQLRINHSVTGSTPQKLTRIDKWGGIVWTSMENAFRGCSNMTIAEGAGAPDLSIVTNMDNMFRGATNLTGDLGNWNVSNITSMVGAFAKTEHFTGNNGNISTWNVSNVTDMAEMFLNAEGFNGSLNDWDVSNVTNMNGAFAGAASFTGSDSAGGISIWNVSKVTDMAEMFSGAIVFNGSLKDWNVSNVTNMESMFSSVEMFTNDLNWNVSKVTNMDNMFFKASSFNADISSWNISNVSSMTNMLKDATSFSSENYDALLTGWSELTPQDDVVFGAPPTTYCAGKAGRKKLTGTYGWTITGDTSCPVAPFVTAWTVTASDTTIKLPIYDDPNRTDDIYDVDTSYDGTTFNADMRNQTGTIEIDFGVGNAGVHTIAVRPNPTNNPSNQLRISHFDVAILPFGERIGTPQKLTRIEKWGGIVWTSMANAFRGCSNMTIAKEGAGAPDLTEVSDMSSMFLDAGMFNSDLNGWDVSNVEKMNHMFFGSRLPSDLSNWNVSNVTGMISMFAYVRNFNGNISSWNVSNVTSMGAMFFFAENFTSDLSNWNVSNVTNMEYMFYNATNFTSDLSWNVSKVTNMDSMFNRANIFNGNISEWNVSNVQHMAHMFDRATSFNGNISEWNVSNVQHMGHMFYRANSFNGNISEWNVSKVTNMVSMFKRANSFNGNISEWNVSNVENMSGMFSNALLFNQDLSMWNVSNVTSMGAMFFFAENFTSDLSNWNVSTVGSKGCCLYGDDMADMFSGATSFNSDLSGWNVSNVTDMENMFTNATSFSPENYDLLLSGWASLPMLRHNVRFGAPPTTYCTGGADRGKLKGEYSWQISGDMENCTPPGIAHNTPFLDIENYSNNDDVFLDTRVYPNPTRGKISIESPFTIEKVELYNILGAKLFSVSKTNALDLTGLRQGIYILKAFSTDRVISKKIIKN